MSWHAVREALAHAEEAAQLPGVPGPRSALQQTVRDLKPADRARLLDVITELIKALGVEEES
jgi:hypothetical protein